MSGLLWTPDWTADPELLHVQENEKNIYATVSVQAAVGDASDPSASPVVVLNPTRLFWSLSPAGFPPQVTVTVTGLTLAIAAPDFIGIFPMVRLKYLLPGEPRDGLKYGTVTAWEDLPNPVDSLEIIEFVPHPIGIKTFYLTVWTDADPNDKAVYEIIVRADFTPGRDRLQREVDARRKKTS